MTRKEAVAIIAAGLGIPRSVVESELTSLLCEECQGEGEYAEWSFYLDGRPSVKTVKPCPDCGGSGMVHREVK